MPLAAQRRAWRASTRSTTVFRIALKPAYFQKSNAWQLSTYASQSPVFDPATSLFVVWLFPNDVFYADKTGMLPGVVPGSPGGANLVANGIANILTTVQTLALGGAQHFLVPNMPDLGMTPDFLNTPGCARSCPA